MNAYLSRIQSSSTFNLASIESILDWGGSDGIMLPDIFHQVKRYIYDISDKHLIDGIKKLKTIEMDFKFSYFQITHVLEHVFQPKKFLEAPLSHLQPGGILYLEVPLECEANGLISKVLNKERRLWAHEHINLYTPLSLRTLVETAGLRVLDLTVETIDFFWCKGPCLRLLASQ